MPSLSELQKFKTSFGDIGREKADLAARKIPYDDLELPDSEPATPATTDPVDDMDFGAFLGTPPDDLPEPPAAIMPETDEAGNPPPEKAADDLYAPEELLSNLSEELDSIPPDFPEESSADTGDSTLDLDSLDNFDLPDEPVPAEGGAPLDLDSLDNFDLPEPAADTADSGAPDSGILDDFDMPAEPSAETDSLGEDSPPDEPVEAGEDLESSTKQASLQESVTSEGSPLDTNSLGDFNIPDEFAGGAPDSGILDDFDMPLEPSAETDSLGEDSPLDEPAEAGEDLDMGSFDDFNIPGEFAGGAPDSDILDDFDMPLEPSAETDSLGEDSPPDEPASPSEDVAEAGEDLDVGSFDDFNVPEESVDADSGAPDLGNLDDFNMPEDSAPSSAEGVEDGGEIELFDESSMGDDNEIVDMENIDDLGLPGEVDDTVDDFSFPELDNVLNRAEEKPAARTDSKDAKKGGLFGKGKARKPVRTERKAPDDVDEIHLSDDELEGLLETLSRYPLNLRIACEEIIAEHAVNPKQMSELIEHLVWGATAKETAAVAGRILGRIIHVPKAFEKSSGAALEAEQASFAYIFVHNFLPVLRVFLFIAAVAASAFYLSYKFIYIPLKAESIYKIGYERIFAGEYQRANERFSEAFSIHRKKVWFYRYAEAFRDERQYIYAEQKYDELLRYYPRDKKGVLDYAYMETYYLRNYAKADTLLRHQLLDYAPDDPDGLLAAGDNYLLWGELDPSKYEDARYQYARLLEKYGWKAPVVERMMKYFIRTDNLKETLILKNWFDRDPVKRKLSAESLGELGGYLLDKQLEEARGVPNEYIEYIDGVRDLLLRAVYADASLPEPHYHLARYYKNLGNTHEERVSLRIAVDRFEKAPEGSIRRLHYHIDALQRYADVLINAREFMPAEEQLIKGINLYEDGLSRRLLSPSPQYGRLYAGLGDLAYFTKESLVGDMEAALRYYHRARENGYAPPEMQYRMGAAYYRLEDWKNALEYLFAASSSLPLNHRVLFALGNTALKRGDYFAAQGYYNRLLDILEGQRSRLPLLLPNDRPEYLELAERLMQARNNAGVANEMLAAQTGNRRYHTRAMALYAEANRAWDSLTRDPRSMIRSGSIPPPYLNSRNTLYPQPGYEPQIFIFIDREALENSPWEELAPLQRLDHGLSN